MKLTEHRIESITVAPGKKDRLVFDEEQRGLAIRVTSSGGRTYLAQYTLDGMKFRVPLGSCSALSLLAARSAAASVMGDVAKGKNPAADRKMAAAAARAKAARDRLTLERLIESWNHKHLSRRRPRYAAEAVRALRHAFGHYLDRPAEELDRRTVVRILDGLQLNHTTKADSSSRNAIANSAPRGASIARSTAAYGRALFSWAVKRGTIDHNPFLNLPRTSEVTSRDRVLSDEELMAVWRGAERTNVPYSAIVCILILTGQRREEVAAMTWDEISHDLRTWTIPGTRTKNGAPHIVPLSEPARLIIREMLPKDEGSANVELVARQKTKSLVFPGKRGVFSGWSKCKTCLDSVSGVTDWRLHDLRRTFATGLQRLGVRLEVTEAALNHLSGSRAGIVGVYQRHDWAFDKRAAIDAWATHVMTVVQNASTSPNVIKMSFA